MEALLEEPITECSVAPRALVADDQQEVVEALRLLLKHEGYETEPVNSPAAILRALETGRFDLLLMDLNYTRDTTSGEEGLSLLSRIQAIDDTLPVVVMTAWGSVELAVEAMQKGVGDFVLKPWDNHRLLATLRTQVAKGQRRRKQRRLEEQECEEARGIQQALLPKEIPQVPGYEISGAWRPARNVGGDYFNVVQLSGGRIGLCVADVMGKGVPAALLMSNLQAVVQTAESQAPEPREICTVVNRLISSHMDAGRFITLFYGSLDVESKKLIYTNAGHNAPMLVRGEGAHTRLVEGGAALGAFPDWRYEQGEVALNKGDRLVLFTDGITEARRDGEEFGEERLRALVKENRGLSAADLRRKILEAVGQFSGGDLEDDATLVVVAVN